MLIVENFEQVGLFLSSFSYLFQPLYAIYLTFQVKDFLRKFLEDRIDKFLLIALFILGILSSLLSANKVGALLVSFSPFIFVWFHIVGKYSIKNPHRVSYFILLGSAVLGLSLLLAKLFRVSLYLNNFPIIDGNIPRGLVLGIRAQGLSLLLEFGIISGLGLILLDRYMSKKLKIFLYIIFCIVGFLITETRGGILGIVVGILVLILNKNSFQLVRKNWKVFLSVILMLFLGIFFINSSFAQRLFVSLSKNTEGSIYERIFIYIGILRMLKDNLWFGVGPGNFIYYYPKYALYDYPYLPEETIERLNLRNAYTTHSFYLYFLSGWGIIGSILFFIWLFRKIYSGLNNGFSIEKQIILAILLTYFAHVIIDDLFSIHVPLLIGLLNNKNWKILS